MCWVWNYLRHSIAFTYGMREAPHTSPSITWKSVVDVVIVVVSGVGMLGVLEVVGCQG